MKRFMLLAMAVIAGQTMAALRSPRQVQIVAQQVLDQPQMVVRGASHYIYNNGNQKGYAILSASDKMRPVLGYSTSGSIDPDQMPDNLKSWLQWVDEATAYVEDHPECALQANALTQNGIQAVEPILANVKWGQGEPYNLQCPVVDGSRSVTGCVATAAAQCVYHYRYPAQGKGSCTSKGTPAVTVNFAQQTYDYDLMFDKYEAGKGYQTSEVAKLSYHCGVISDMKYAADGSGASDANLAYGLVNYFGYDPYCQDLNRNCYTIDEWNAILRNELEHGRPIIYSGVSQETGDGHSFVVDGIDADGLYHVNWGWYGEYDGYFDIVVLRPEAVGIGAEICDDGFCADQSAIIQLAPPGRMTDAKYYTPMMAPKGSFTLNSQSVTLGQSLSFSIVHASNLSKGTVTGRFGIAFCQNGEVKQYLLRSAQATTLQGFYGGDFNGSVTIPANLPKGQYQVYACFVPTSGDFENECGLIRLNAKQVSYYDCTVANGKATFTRGSNLAQLSVSGWNKSDSPLAVGEEQTLRCQVKNLNTKTSLVGKYYVGLTSPQGKETFFEADEVLTLAPSAQATLSFPVQFNQPGSWQAALYIYYQNLDEDPETVYLIDGSAHTFQVGEGSAIETLTLDSPSASRPVYDLWGRQTPATHGKVLIEKGKLKVEK